MGYELLWENPSPASIFGAQPVNVDLSSYKTIIIVFKYSLDTGHMTSQMFTERGANRGFMLGGYMVYRSFTIYDDKINFDAGTMISSYGSGKTDSNYCVPLKIYGVKS